MASEFGTVRDYERALTFALRNATLNQKRILGAHLAAPGQTMSAQQLAKVVGFKTFGGTNAQYGTFARAVAKRLGLRRKPKGFWLNVLAEWAAQAPVTGHTRFVLRPEVVTALKNPRVGLSSADGPRLWILIGGNDKFNGDYSLIGRLAGNGGTMRWGGRTLAKAQPGDQILLYVGRPHSQLIARARFVGPPKKGGPYGYRAPISGVEMLSPALSLHALKKQFPKWGWLMQPRSSTLVPDSVAGRLRRLATVPGEGPATRNGRLVRSASRASTGAGFGDNETNKKVEKRAVDHVKGLLKKEGYKVKSVEHLDGLGYDLEATRSGLNSRPMLVEVKGIQGEKEVFHLTRSEIERSEDKDFVLYAVTSALRRPKAQVYTGEALRSLFSLTPVMYRACLMRDTRPGKGPR